MRSCFVNKLAAFVTGKINLSMRGLKHLFLHDPNVVYLNHGSFGACTRSVFEAYQQFQLQLEQEPVQFITAAGPALLQKSKEALAKYIRCDADDLVFTSNPTYAINIIAKSLDLKPGDEILASSHEYGAMDRTWSYYTRKAGAKYVQQEVRLPVISREQMIEDFWKGYSPKTKAVFVNQMSSATALLFPVKEICDRAKELGLLTIVDGAHIPGHFDLDLSKLKADIYTGACHKWLLTPKGNSFLYVKKEYQDRFDPLLISWGYEAERPGKSKYLDYHEYQGTRDFSAFLTVPKSLEFFAENNWTAVSAECKTAILKNYERFCAIAGTTPICPVSSDYLGQMCSIPVNTAQPDLLKKNLFEEFRIEIPVMSWRGRVFVRISLNGYNSDQDLDVLENAMRKLLRV